MLKEKILQIITDHPKHYSSIITRNAELKSWVLEHASERENFASRIYSAVSGTSGVCAHGSTMKFKSIQEGWGFCGKTAHCACAKSSVSAKVRAAAANLDQARISEKRKHTLREKHGVDNPGQTAAARLQHQKLYSDREQVQLLVAKTQNTLLERYGVANPRHIPGVEQRIQQTNLERYAVANAMQHPSVQARSQATRKEKYSTDYLLAVSHSRMQEKFAKQGYDLLCDELDYQGVTKRYNFQHHSCGHVFETYINNGKNPVCPICFYHSPSYVSRAETQLADWISNLGVTVVRQERSLIRPSHLDIFLPEHSLAIEYCGLYWHSEWANGKSKDYHLRKLERCQAVGVDLITVFEDEWLKRQATVKSIISNRLGFSQKLGARSCDIVSLSNTQARDFFDNNHLQGHTNASSTLALVHHDRPVFAMSFGRSRYNKKYSWELLRMCSAPGTQVMGGAQRLMRASGKTNIISYADRRWFTGQTYEKLGMTALEPAGPGYWYTDYSKRWHRSNFTKKQLVQHGYNPGNTEVQIMQQLGYDRIWDCGNLVFVLE